MMRIVTADDAPRESEAPAPLRVDGITTGVRVLLVPEGSRFYPLATSYVYAGDWLLVEDEDDTLAAIERSKLVAVELGHATLPAREVRS